MIRAILFDYAGTMTEDIRPVLHELAETSGADLAELGQMLVGGGPGSDHPWCRFERGEITMSEVVEWGRAEGAARGWTLDFAPMLSGIISTPIRTGMIERIRGLRERGYRTALVTNNAKELATLWRSMMPVDELFDVVVDSSAVGVRKPEPEIFDITLQRLGATAAEVILFEDVEVNIAAAKAYGMGAVMVHANPASAYAELDRLLALTPS